jgi:ribosomal protein S18 acetylase RimI-like enzyme
MDADVRFELDGWATRRLGLDDEAALADLLVRCDDHFRLHEHRSPGADVARDELTDLPPGRSPADKHVHGIEDPTDPHRLIGVIESVSGHPDRSSWYLGLLLIDPEHRGGGLGSAAVPAFERMVARAGFDRVRLAVIEPNTAGRRFWERHGYELAAIRDDHHLGPATHRAFVLDKSVRPTGP